MLNAKSFAMLLLGSTVLVLSLSCNSVGKAETISKPAAGESGAEKQEVPVIVNGAVVKSGTLVKDIRTQGRVVCRRKQSVTARVEGRIVDGVFRNGVSVKKGGVIVRIDDRRYRLAVNQAEAELSKAISELVVNQYDLKDSGADSVRKVLNNLDKQYRGGKIDFDTYMDRSFEVRKKAVADGTLRKEVAFGMKGASSARYQLEQAKLNLENCRITAPFDGVTAEMEAFKGRYVNVGDHLFDFLDPAALYVKASIMETELPFVAKGKAVELRFPAWPGRVFKGTVDEINPVVDGKDRTVSVFIHVENKGGKVFEGMYADVKVDTVRLKSRMLVPLSAVVVREGRPLVFVVGADRRAKWIYVKVVDKNDRVAAIVSDSSYDSVKVGDTVVATNNFTLGHGSLVEVKKIIAF
ncbi:MAG: efflux RND transporter periplasmic adaptor subunit [Acidobacteria bacterium]|nr:efflux RND transporter periplasmic adaptor subunit [Acidobacteriota bacterium]